MKIIDKRKVQSAYTFDTLDAGDVFQVPLDAGYYLKLKTTYSNAQTDGHFDSQYNAVSLTTGALRGFGFKQSVTPIDARLTILGKGDEE